MATVTKPIVLDETMKELLSMIDGVRSVNGLTGAVVLDGNNLKINAANASSKTFKQAFDAAGKATVTYVQGSQEDYKVTITRGNLN